MENDGSETTEPDPDCRPAASSLPLSILSASSSRCSASSCGWCWCLGRELRSEADLESRREEGAAAAGLPAGVAGAGGAAGGGGGREDGLVGVWVVGAGAEEEAGEG